MAKPCQVEKEVFEDCCVKAARFILKREEWLNYDTQELGYMQPPEAAVICGFSIPTFKLRARQYLLPEVYGNLPDDFFTSEKKGAWKHKNPGNYGNRPYAKLRDAYEEMQNGARTLPRLGDE